MLYFPRMSLSFFEIKVILTMRRIDIKLKGTVVAATIAVKFWL